MDKIFIRLDKLTKFQSDELSENDLIEVIVKYYGDIKKAGSELGADVEILSTDYAIITISIKQLPNLYNQKEVEYIELPRNMTYILRFNLNSACITPVQSTAGVNLSGKGVVVGIIDSGIDYTHPDFINEDGTSRILFLWDQTIESTPPAGFRNGTEYTNSQINAALKSPTPLSVVPSNDNIGHGTAVAGVAAGNGKSSGGVERGVAFEASIIVVKLGHTGNESFTRTTEIMRAVKYISDKAESLNMPLAINISYGTNNGSHDANSLFERYLDSMCEKWKTVISVATGNEGSAAHHFNAKVAQDETVTAEFVVGGNLKSLYITLWKNFVDTISFELIAPSGNSTSIIAPVQSVTRVTLDGVVVSVLYGQPNHYSVEQEVYFLFSTRGQVIKSGIWNLVARGEHIIYGTFDAWLPTVEDVAEGTSFLRPDINTTLTLPSTSRYVIAVGGYDSSINTAAEFSGRGPDRGSVLTKPDLVAPAVGINTTKSGGGYDTYSGTSLAVPFVTGSAALMMEWGIIQDNDPFLFGQRVKAFLRRGARRTFSIDYLNNIWGYGTLSLCDSMRQMVEYNRGGGAFS
jgi:subtilisin family serine protease